MENPIFTRNAGLSNVMVNLLKKGTYKLAAEGFLCARLLFVESSGASAGAETVLGSGLHGSHAAVEILWQIVR